MDRNFAGFGDRQVQDSYIGPPHRPGSGTSFRVGSTNSPLITSGNSLSDSMFMMQQQQNVLQTGRLNGQPVNVVSVNTPTCRMTPLPQNQFQTPDQNQIQLQDQRAVTPNLSGIGPPDPGNQGPFLSVVDGQIVVNANSSSESVNNSGRQSKPTTTSKPTHTPQNVVPSSSAPSPLDGDAASDASGKDSRYVNTMQALEKAGLLDITLKTAELLKQNKNMQRDIDTLEEIVKASYEAVMSGDSEQ